ncbi:transient receptor potential cation channel subfamily V member 6-like [Spea bombifrons]|uniref:transient receptor potential cation channel subfamily V member 6-like n=1 Tax=Spea bombifrons TaxID=233779 RepID=UPI00234A5F4F|nr:transient receptor potential cation channel subfamily V member 6-like [Spea bombifrons]
MLPKESLTAVLNNLRNSNTRDRTLFFKAAKENNVKVLERLIEEGVDPLVKGAMGENVLHLTALYNNLEALVLLLDAFPFLINKSIECEIYKGETALHIAIINQNADMVKELIARKADTRNARAVGTFFAPRRKGHYYYGEYVTSFAASVGNQEILQLLVESGAPLQLQDNQGNTVLHILVLHPNKAMACKTYDFLISLIPEEQVAHLESIANNDGLTPLKLAAQEGDTVMFRFFMKRKRHTYSSFGPLTSALYDLTEIDSWDDKQSVIDVICSCKNSLPRHLLEITPLKELLLFKWSTFGYKYFLLCTLLYVLYTTILTSCCLYRPLMEEREAAYGEERRVVTKPLQEWYISRDDYVRLFGEIIVITGAFIILIAEISRLVRKGPRHFFGNTVTGGPFHVIMLLYGCFILTVVILRFARSDGETAVMSLALISAWCNVIYFARGFRLLGPLCIMIQKMILDDLLRFCVILAIALIGFAAAFDVHFQAMNATMFPQFHDFPETVFTLFQLMMGLNKLQVPSNVTMPTIITLLYMVYMFFAFVLLLNLLIALMTDTHFRVSSERTSLWRAQVADTTIMFERMLPSWLWPRTGIPGEIIGLQKGKWYLRVNEKNNVFLPEKMNTQENPEKPKQSLLKNWSLVHADITNMVKNKRIHQHLAHAHT